MLATINPLAVERTSGSAVSRPTRMTLLTIVVTSSSGGRQPGLGVHRPAVPADLEVQVRPGREAAGAEAADLLAGDDGLGAAKRGGVQVPVERRQPTAVVDHHVEPVATWVQGRARDAGGGRPDRRGPRGGPVDAPVGVARR